MKSFIVEEDFTTQDAALANRINILTARNYAKTDNNDPQKWLLGSYNNLVKRPYSKLAEERSKYVEKTTTKKKTYLKVMFVDVIHGVAPMLAK